MTSTDRDGLAVARNGEVSFWQAQAGGAPTRPPLIGSTEADVCIVGAGLTGLWTAYYLKKADPSLRVVVLERDFAGFGASGRNGGWLSNFIPGSRQRYAQRHGRDAVVELQAQMNRAIDETIAVADAEGIDADIRKSGVLTVARSTAQRHRLGSYVAAERAWGNTDIELLGHRGLSDRIRVSRALDASYSPHCARLDPAKLVLGLAEAVTRLGVELYESTTVTAIESHRARTETGSVTADHVLCATEGFCGSIRGRRRDLLPMNSSMIITAPLSEEHWASIGWAGGETLGDLAHGFFYAQRTADDRIAIGGRGVPYLFGSAIVRDGRTADKTIDSLRQLLGDCFPILADVQVAHAWSGVLGVSRDWCASVSLDRHTGIGGASGYAGHGLTATNLAARTLRDLVLGVDTSLTRLPWVAHPVRRWEPEPLRWLGVHSLYAAYRLADRRENSRLRHTSVLALLADRIAGRH